MHRRLLIAAVVVLTAGCAVPQEKDDGLLDVAIETPEQRRAARLQDIESAKKTEEWLIYVCSKTGEERQHLIQETIAKHGWRIACPGGG